MLPFRLSPLDHAWISDACMRGLFNHEIITIARSSVIDGGNAVAVRMACLASEREAIDGGESGLGGSPCRDRTSLTS
jgi:hypothetical protein